MRALLALAAAALAHAENKVEVLNDQNYNLFIGGATPVFVKFYAPWCGHCKRMAPAWAELGEAVDAKKMVIADADCTAEDSKKVCDKFGVSGFPTIKYFEAKDETGAPYNGGRDFEGLKDFVDEHLGGSCGPDAKDLCSEEEAKFLDEWAAKGKEAAQKELNRLQGLKRGRTKEQSKWFKTRVKLLKKIE
eukprot:TRINITY_DN751_c0_g1_i2.p1 TRINITY_DN751_c0_g1~~TRINITY_DN751_c0_g1_i2.p1  ORF type:complete len:190 (+),score=114.12 TRINITY_DN751_c0_g1_i2:61-630(+)